MSKHDYSRPFRTRIVEDCREDGDLTGQFGYCLGLYEYPLIDKKMPDGRIKNSALKYNPLIRTEGGDYIWGCECFWVGEDLKDEPLDKLQSALQAHKEDISKILDEMEFVKNAHKN